MWWVSIGGTSAEGRHGVVHQRRRQQLPGVVVDAVLRERAAEALRDPAGDLALDERGIDDAPAVVHRHVAQHAHLTRLDVDLDDGEVGAVGEGPRSGVRIVHGRLEARLDPAELVRPEVRGARELGVAQPAFGAPTDDGAAAAELDVGGMRLEQRRRDGSDALAQRPRGEQRRASADRHAAARPGASAVRHDGGVPENTATSSSGTSSSSAMICASAVWVPWPWLVTPTRAVTAPAGLEPHGRSLLARDRRAPDAVELGARAGELDEAGEPDSHVAPSGASGLLFPPQPIVVGGLQESRQRG